MELIREGFIGTLRLLGCDPATYRVLGLSLAVSGCPPIRRTHRRPISRLLVRLLAARLRACGTFLRLRLKYRFDSRIENFRPPKMDCVGTAADQSAK